MNQSETIAELASALSKAQAAIHPPTKGETAGAGKYSYRYADLATVWEAVRGPLTSNGLSVVQSPFVEGTAVTVETRLFHESGEWLSSSLTLHAAKPDPQGIGSAITYGRRYSLMALVGVAPEDDDGRAAMPAAADAINRALSQPPPAPPEPPQAAPPVVSIVERVRKSLPGYTVFEDVDGAFERLKGAECSDEERKECEQLLKGRYKELIDASLEQQEPAEENGAPAAEEAGTEPAS